MSADSEAASYTSATALADSERQPCPIAGGACMTLSGPGRRSRRRPRSAGGVVTAVDPTPQLLAIADHRARQENLAIAWQEGVAERIDAADHSFDRVLSVFGAMYSPSPAAAASELVRCCRPGGRIIVTAWTPDSFMAATNRAVAPYLPPPPPAGTPPTQWGDIDFVRSLFASKHASVTTTIATVNFDFPTLDAAADFWIRTAGHLRAEQQRLDSQGLWGRLRADLQRCFADANTDRAGRISVHSTYLLTAVSPHRTADHDS
ncbi:class I SAM-dependent methyltransferase [Actinomycetes bacterium KLBMP 9797]